MKRFFSIVSAAVFAFFVLSCKNSIRIAGVSINGAEDARILYCGDGNIDKETTLSAEVNVLEEGWAYYDVEWHSSDSKVASVGKKTGVVTAHKPGKAMITAKAVSKDDRNDWKSSEPVEIEVCLGYVDSTRLFESETPVSISEFISEGVFEELSEAAGSEGNGIEWTILLDGNPTTAVEITSDGSLRFNSNGICGLLQISGRSGENEIVSVSVKVGVPLNSISFKDIFDGSLTLNEEEEIVLEVNFDPAGASNKNVIWNSTNPAVAAVDSRGKVSAIARGTTVVTAVSEDGGYVATCNLKVNGYATEMDIVYEADDRSVGSKVSFLPGQSIALKVSTDSDITDRPVSWMLIPNRDDDDYFHLNADGDVVEITADEMLGAKADLIAMTNDGSGLTKLIRIAVDKFQLSEFPEGDADYKFNNVAFAVAGGEFELLPPTGKTIRHWGGNNNNNLSSNGNKIALSGNLEKGSLSRIKIAYNEDVEPETDEMDVDWHSVYFVTEEEIFPSDGSVLRVEGCSYTDNITNGASSGSSMDRFKCIYGLAESTDVDAEKVDASFLECQLIIVNDESGLINGIRGTSSYYGPGLIPIGQQAKSLQMACVLSLNDSNIKDDLRTKRQNSEISNGSYQYVAKLKLKNWRYNIESEEFDFTYTVNVNL